MALCLIWIYTRWPDFKYGPYDLAKPEQLHPLRLTVLKSTGKASRSHIEQVSERFVPRVVVVEIVVEFEQVIMVDRSADLRLVQLCWKTPCVDGYAGGDKKIDGARLSALEHRHLAGRARERVIAAVVVDTNPDAYVSGCEFDITAGFATRPNGSHEWKSSLLVAACVRASIGTAIFFINGLQA